MAATEEPQQSSEGEKPQTVDTPQNNETEKNIEASLKLSSNDSPLDPTELEPIVTLKTWIVTVVGANS